MALFNINVSETSQRSHFGEDSMATLGEDQGYFKSHFGEDYSH